MLLVNGKRRGIRLAVSEKVVVFFLAVFSLVLLAPSSALAAGGACPSAAQYLNAATNTQNVTLSSLGITSCYYVAANGSDGNSGTSESSPWLHAPQMPSCSGNCAAVQNQSGGVSAGTGIILRGGDTWHLGNSGASPYTGGAWDWNTGQYPIGTASHPIYLGVDQTWYSGSTWARPILTGDNPVTQSTTLGSCPYNITGAGGQANNNIINFGNTEYIIVDNFEMLGLCESDNTSGGTPAQGNTYIRYPFTSNMTFINLYMHGTSHIQYSCSGGSGHCFNLFFLGGGCCVERGDSSNLGETIAYTIADNCDSDVNGAGLFVPGFYNVYESVFRCQAQGIYGYLHTFHDNLLEIWSSPGDLYAHPNLLESDGEFNGTNAFYNNVVRHVCSGGVANCPNGLVGWLPQPKVGQSEYAFNNVMYDSNSIEGPMTMGGPINVGTLIYFNNTLQRAGSGSSLFSCYPTNPPTAPWTSTNDHIISDIANPYTPQCTSQQIASPVTDLVMTNSTATSKSYASTQSYAYSPGTSSSPTVGVGTNLQSVCSTLSGSSDPLLQAAGTACKSDTTFGPAYNTTTHTVTGLARQALARPSSGSWDIGAYQFGSQAALSPPVGLAAVGH